MARPQRTSLATCAAPLKMASEVHLLAMGAALEGEATAMERVCTQPGSFIRFWESIEQCIVAPAGMALREPNFPAACKALAEFGWPVYQRRTGGCITPQARGILNVTQVFRAPLELGIDESYDRLCSPIELVLKNFGHTATRGSLPEVFCNGRHNVQIDGKKFAGTAQRRSLCRDEATSVAILNHALMIIDPLPMIAFEALRLFHKELGGTVSIHPNAHGWLSSQPRSTFVSALAAAYNTNGKTNGDTN
jgi:hypothetical protein